MKGVVDKDLAIAALSAGKHVLVGKPMARTYQEARATVDAPQKTTGI